MRVCFLVMEQVGPYLLLRRVGYADVAVDMSDVHEHAAALGIGVAERYAVRSGEYAANLAYPYTFAN